MSENNEKKVLLSLKNVDVKFNVRGRILSAIRNVSLDVYENESLAIVGESGSGKSVLTKTFAGLLETNGFISNGTIIFDDEELSATDVSVTGINEKILNYSRKKLNEYSKLERGAADYVAYKQKQNDIKAAKSLTEEEQHDFSTKLKDCSDDIIDSRNYLWTLDKHSSADAEEYQKTTAKIKALTEKQKALKAEMKALTSKRKAAYAADTARSAADKKELAELLASSKEKTTKDDVSGNECGLSNEILDRNKLIANEILLSIGRYPLKAKITNTIKILNAFKIAMKSGEDISDPAVRNKIFEVVAFRVEYRSYDEASRTLHGYAIIDCAKIKLAHDWQLIRGRRIATVFQDPMTSLNPVITIGKQIMTVVKKHQQCSDAEAKKRTLDIMAKVGIPDPEKRFNDYPFEYSGGMRQRIVIAIALSCQPKILICDEPTTALDVTIQAQIIRLIKDLQRELGFTTVYITHDLGVVANVAERVAVLYGGQIVEIGNVEEIFYDPKHPYTWALLSSLPQLAEKGTDLFSIPGTPPSLYNKIVGDAFAPRNQYAMAIDLVKEPPMFKVSETHYAKTWLLDPRAPKTEAPKNIQNLHEKMLKSYVNLGEEAANGTE